MELSVHQDKDAIIVAVILLQDDLSLLEVDELGLFESLFHLIEVKNVLNVRFVQNASDGVVPDDLFATIPQTSFDLLGAHRDYLNRSLGNEGVRPHSSFHQN